MKTCPERNPKTPQLPQPISAPGIWLAFAEGREMGRTVEPNLNILDHYIPKKRGNMQYVYIYVYIYI